MSIEILTSANPPPAPEPTREEQHEEFFEDLPDFGSKRPEYSPPPAEIYNLPIEPSKEERAFRTRLINKIKSAKELFPEDTRTVDLFSLDSKSNEQLQDTIDDIDRSLNTTGGSDMAVFATVKLAALVEKLTEGTGLKLKGLSADIERDKALIKMLRTLAWQYDSFFDIPLHMRIPLHIAIMAYMRHEMNEAEEQNKARYNKTAPAEIVSKYADL